MLIFGLIAQAQPHHVRVPLGQNLITNTPFEGTVTSFKGLPKLLTVNEADGTALYEVHHRVKNKRDKLLGYRSLVYFNHVSDSIIWREPFIESDVTYWAETPYLFSTQENVTTVYELQEKSELWKKKFSPVADFHEAGIAIGYERPEIGVGLTPNVLALDIATGQELWSRKLYRSSFIEGFGLVGNRLDIIAKGIFRLDLHTGTGWSAKYLDARFKDYRARSDGINCTGVFEKVITEVNREALVLGLRSNLYELPNQELLFASNGSFVRLNNKGEELWSVNLGKVGIGQSELIEINANTVGLFNLGIGVFNKEQIQYCAPYFAYYNVETGVKQNQIEFEKIQTIEAKYFKDDVFYIIYNRNQLGCYNINEQIFTSSNIIIDSFMASMTGMIYLQNDNSFERFESSGLALSTAEGKVFDVDEGCNLVETYRLSEFWPVTQKLGDYLVITNMSGNQIIDKSGTVIAKIPTGNILGITDEQLLIQSGRKVFSVDVSPLSVQQYPGFLD